MARICDIGKAETATHRITILLHPLDAEHGDSPQHELTLDAGQTAVQAVLCDDLYALGQLVPRKDRAKTAVSKPRQARRGANPDAVAAASGGIGGE